VKWSLMPSDRNFGLPFAEHDGGVIVPIYVTVALCGIAHKKSLMWYCQQKRSVLPSSEAQKTPSALHSARWSTHNEVVCPMTTNETGFLWTAKKTVVLCRMDHRRA
jgi:hypothetical protein